MGFLAGEHLAEQVLSDRLGEERIAGAADDGEEPGQHQQRKPGDARRRA